MRKATVQPEYEDEPTTPASDDLTDEDAGGPWKPPLRVPLSPDQWMEWYRRDNDSRQRDDSYRIKLAAGTLAGFAILILTKAITPEQAELLLVHLVALGATYELVRRRG